ncbi:MAG TPA: hypothetical protein V6C88_08195, partial [Chroococcidiopsis sp.]
GSHWSGNLINLACTNALAMIPVGQTSIAAGDLVPILQIGAPIVRARSECMTEGGDQNSSMN